MLEPYFERDGITIYHGDCVELMPQLTARMDWVITDPPYGAGKAEWDERFPTSWLEPAAAVVNRGLAIMPGIDNLLRCPHAIADFEYRWALSIHLSNGMTRGRMGFGNWIPVLVYARAGDSLYRPQQDAAEVPISGDMPDHPSPKPLRAMSWLLSRFDDTATFLDPFMGSGTTLRAAYNLGRTAIGIEIEERYCEIAAKRLQQGVLV